MHRSHSTTRVADEYYRTLSTAVSGAPSSADADDHLPMYSPMSDVVKKEKSRLRSAENAVHLIPLILVLCAIILWSFSSNPVDVNRMPDAIVASEELLKAAGSIAIDGTHNSLPHLENSTLKVVDLLHHQHQHQHQHRHHNHHLKPST